MMAGQALDGVAAAHKHPVVPGDKLSRLLLRCLQHVHWVGGQLQQLVLPGKQKKAAAALQDLQEQQQQLQQALIAAVWRLDKAGEIMRAVTAQQIPQSTPFRVLGFDPSSDTSYQLSYWLHYQGLQLRQQQQQQRQQCNGSSSSSSSSSSNTPIAQLTELASCQPDETLQLADLVLAQQQQQQQNREVFLSPKVAVDVAGPKLSQQLQQFGSALWSALPQPRCCNNAGCTNLAGVSEAKLVLPAAGSGRSNKCSACKTAR
jgi:hypothetical protein